MPETGTSRSWQVLLIGGSTGVGKTTLARVLSQHFGVPLLLADDIRMSIQAVTTPDQLPALHYFFSHDQIWDQPVEALVEGWFGVAEVVSKALETVIAHHVVVEGVGPIIIEGDALLPSLCTKREFAWSGPVEAGKVRSFFVYEADEAVLLENVRRRGRGFDTLMLAQQINFGQAAARFGTQLANDAQILNIPVLDCHPWETLPERALQCLE
jgi:2-phosphoglycerate kinase